MHQLLSFITKLPSVLQHAILTSLSVLIILLYLHTDFKDSINKSLRTLNKRLDGIERSIERQAYDTRIEDTAINTKLSEASRLLVSIEDKLLKEVKRVEHMASSRLSKLEARVFDLDRFVAKAETHIDYARARLGFDKKGK